MSATRPILPGRAPSHRVRVRQNGRERHIFFCRHRGAPSPPQPAHARNACPAARRQHVAHPQACARSSPCQEVKHDTVQREPLRLARASTCARACPPCAGSSLRPPYCAGDAPTKDARSPDLWQSVTVLCRYSSRIVSLSSASSSCTHHRSQCLSRLPSTPSDAAPSRAHNLACYAEMALQQENTNMDEIADGLWIGNIHAAVDHEALRAHNVYSVLSAMRGKVSVHETFTHFQIQLDDTEDADALAFFPQCISFIENELDQGRGVLVHCQAGMSRSATIVAAYLMYAQQLDAQGALDVVVKARPCTQPNDGFLAQLEVFYQAAYKVSRKNKVMRMYYLERALDEIMNGDGTLPSSSTSMFANFPRSPSDSLPTTPGGSASASGLKGPRRRIRCKMCRTELAAREHMLDHGQVGPATPASAMLSPAVSRRPSTHAHDAARPGPFGLAMTPRQAVSRRSSVGAGAGAGAQERPRAGLATLNGEPVSVPVSLQMRRLSVPAGGGGRPLDLHPLTALAQLSPGAGGGSRTSSFGTRPRRPSNLAREVTAGSAIPEGVSVDVDSSALDDDEEEEEEGEEDGRPEGDTASAPGPGRQRVRGAAGSASYMSPMDLAAQLNVHPKLAALRSPGLGGIGGLQPMSPIASANAGLGAGGGGGGGALAKQHSAAAKSPPLITNSACSGYFVEPMKWMEPFLEAGELAGKIMCPNKKCGAKLGNYDWAGVCCSCKEWVVPGFCIHRSKVDEVVV